MWIIISVISLLIGTFLLNKYEERKKEQGKKLQELEELKLNTATLNYYMLGADYSFVLMISRAFFHSAREYTINNEKRIVGTQYSLSGNVLTYEWIIAEKKCSNYMITGIPSDIKYILGKFAKKG